MKRVECVIKGRVQGVMFRDFTRRHAKKLGVVGTVENTADGGVFVVAEGHREMLEAFIVFLKKGPLFAKIEDIVIRWTDASGAFDDFRIIYRDVWDRI